MLRSLIEGKEVSLERDITNKDRSGRLLRYVFVKEEFVNLRMIKEGLANTYIVEPDVKYSKELLKAEEEAMRKGIGIWKLSGFYSRCIKIEKFNYDARGKDGENLNDEYVVFKNVCGVEIELTNWSIKDKSSNFYVFPKIKLPPGEKLTLHSGSGINGKNELFWNSSMPIWNNGGDCLYLKDEDGNLVLFSCY